jgi:hypothetical protein
VVFGRSSSVNPQSMQTKSSGDAKIGGASRFFSPEKWTIISDLTFCWFSEVHDLQAIRFT